MVAVDRPESHLLEPFWKSDTQFGESLLFVQQNPDERPMAHLLFTPLRLLSLQSATGVVRYIEGQDYVLDQKSKTLFLPQGSRIPFKTDAELHPPKKSLHSMNNAEDSKRDLLWSEGRFFHDLQVEATYTHKSDEWELRKGYVPVYAGSILPLTTRKLREKKPLHIVMLGDSISAGYNASGFIKAPPLMPPYPELVRRNLQQRFGAPVDLTNLSVAGKVTTWGLQQSDAVIAAKPDLVVLAFGMNDSGGITPELYVANISKQISQIKASLPDVEFIVVASSLPNPEWQSGRGAMLKKYQAKLKEMSGPGIAVADMTAVWTELLASKKYVEITGNGLNHPNDFGHRLYAQVVLGLLVDKPAL